MSNSFKMAKFQEMKKSRRTFILWLEYLIENTISLKTHQLLKFEHQIL